MKLLTFLLFALGTRIPIDNESENELLRRRREASCDTEKIKSFLDDRMKQCKRFNIEHEECAKWAHNELQRECGGIYNCVVTNYSKEVAAHGRYFGIGSPSYDS